MITHWQLVWDELKLLWRGLPNSVIFLVLFASWCLLFVLYGNNTFGYRDTPSLFSWMYYVYTTSPDDDYCLFIPVVVLGLLIWKRKILIQVEKRIWWPSLLIFVSGILFHLVGYLVQQNRVSIIGFVIGLYGLTGLVWGKGWLASTFFPMVLLTFLVPLGAVNDSLTHPLRLFVTKVSVGVGNLFLGLGYEARGAIILTENGMPAFDVAPACSGIRSLVSLFALSTIYAFTQFESCWKRAVIIACSIPLAIVGNLLRLGIVLIVGRAIGFDAAASAEQNLGFLTFVVAFAGLLSLGRKLNRSNDTKHGADLKLETAS